MFLSTTMAPMAAHGTPDAAPSNPRSAIGRSAREHTRGERSVRRTLNSVRTPLLPEMQL